MACSGGPRQKAALPLLVLALVLLAGAWGAGALAVHALEQPSEPSQPGAARRTLQQANEGWQQIDGVGGRQYDLGQNWQAVGGGAAGDSAKAAAAGPAGDAAGTHVNVPVPAAAAQRQQQQQQQQRSLRDVGPGILAARGPQQDVGQHGELHPGPQARHEQQQQQGQPATQRRVPLGAITAMTLVMSLASGLGAVPFFLFGSLSRPWAGLANAVASGVMLAASFGLLAEGAPHGGVPLVVGMLLGAAFIKASQQYLEKYEVESFEELRGADARRVILFLAVMAAHAVGEGSGVGVSFSGDRGWAAGTTVALAIGLHNVPEGLAVATVLAARGAPPRRLLLWTTLTALPQALVAVPSFLFVEAFAALLPLAMGFAAGCMTWIVAAELLPDALEALDHGAVATAATASAAWLQGLAVFIRHLETAPPPAAPGDPPGPQLLPLALSLLLPCLAPGVAAGMAANLLPSRPAALGVSAGALAGGGALGLLWLAAGGKQPLWLSAALAAAGAGAAAMVWQEMAAGSGGADGPPSEPHKKHDGDALPKTNGYTSLCNGGAAGHAPYMGHAHHPHIYPHHHHQHNAHHLAEQQQRHAQLSVAGSDSSPTCAHIRAVATAAAAFDAPSKAPHHAKPQPSTPRGGEGLTLWPGARAAAAGCGGAVLWCCSRGAALAAALLVPGQDSGRLMVPMVLHGALAGLACGCALVPVSGSAVRRVGASAVALCASGPVVALSLLLVGPAAYGAGAGSLLQATAAAAAAYSAGAEMLLAAASGWAAHAGAALLLPQARAWHARRGGGGFVLGVVLAAAGGAISAGLCFATPYCLQPLHTSQQQ